MSRLSSYASGQASNLSAPNLMHGGGTTGTFKFVPQPGEPPPFGTQPLSGASGFRPPSTQAAFSSQASQPRQERSFDIRTSETFYGDMPPTQPQNLGMPPDLYNAETFVADPAPSIHSAGGGSRGAYPAQEAARSPQGLPQQRAQPGREYDSYSVPARLQGVAIGAAQGVFAPAPAAAKDGTQAVIDAKVKARELQFQLKLEMKHLEREARKLSLEEGKLQRKMRAEAERRGNTYEAQLLAKSVVQTRKAVARLEKLKASMHGVVLQLTESIAAMSMRSCLKLSSDVMRQMGELGRLPELEAAVQQMRHEAAAYTHAESCLEDAFRDHEVEEASATEVQKILEELALDRQLEFMAASSSVAGSVPQSAVTVPQTVPRTVPQLGSQAPQTVPLTRLPSAASAASTIIPPGWQQDGYVS